MLFLTEVDTLLQGGILRFKNSNGYKNLSLPHAQSALKFRDNLRVLIINLNAISELFMINDKEVQLLSCIERPLVKLQFKASQNSQKEFGNQRIVLAKLPEDENTYKLATSLRKHNVDFLIYEDEAIQEDLQVSYYEHNNIIIKGDRCVFPIKDDTTNEIYQNSAQYYAYKGSVFQGVLSLEKPNIDTCIGVYLSFKHKSSFCVYTAEHGYKEIITIQTLPCDMTQCLTEISSMDENVTRLFENYTKKFPSILRKEHPLLEGSSLNKLLDLLVYILDFQNKTAFEEAALMCTSKSGMSLDFNVIKVEGKNRLDYRKIAQSMMSYKLAGVPHTLLAYSFYESLAASIGENVTKINTEIKTSKVLLCGDFFANSIVLSKCYKNLTKYDVTVPQSLPLDY
jgi:hydrogenase maturation factor HypF (carbamoyltransferase family)